MVEEKIRALIDEKLKEELYSDCFFVEMLLKGDKRLEIYLDSDSGITFQQCQRMSRHIEAVLDEEKWFGEKYTLEVSSPGIGKPLKLHRQYLKNIGRDLEVRVDGEKPVVGELIDVKEEEFTVTREEKFKEGKKNVKKMVEYMHSTFRESVLIAYHNEICSIQIM